MTKYTSWVAFAKHLEAKDPEFDIARERDFTRDVGHTVWLASFRDGRSDKDTPWLVCECDVRESLSCVENTKTCKLKERARQILLQEIRDQNYSRWCAMSLADVIYDVWNMHKAGSYVGAHGLENPPAALQLIELLVPPVKGEDRPYGFCYPGKRDDFWPAMAELERRKLLEADGLTIMEYHECFRFPRDLFWQLVPEHRIAERDPHCGFGGIGAIREICADVARRTMWKKGETIFGKNIPWLIEGAKERCRDVWIPALDIRFGDATYQDKARVLDEIPVEVWIGWLKFIRRDLKEHGLF